MMSVYENCPVLENEKYVLRFVKKDDASDLLKVYSDKHALPFFLTVITVMAIILIIRQ